MFSDLIYIEFCQADANNIQQIATFISTDQSQEILEREMLIQNEYIRLYIS